MRFTVEKDVTVASTNGSPITFAFAVIDTEARTVEYVATRDACRSWAKQLNTDEGARDINASYGNHYPIIEGAQA